MSSVEKYAQFITIQNRMDTSLLRNSAITVNAPVVEKNTIIKEPVIQSIPQSLTEDYDYDEDLEYGATAGGIMGAAGGAGIGLGGGTLTGAALGGVGGAVIGAAIPTIYHGGRAVVRHIQDMWDSRQYKKGEATREAKKQAEEHQRKESEYTKAIDGKMNEMKQKHGIDYGFNKNNDVVIKGGPLKDNHTIIFRRHNAFDGARRRLHSFSHQILYKDGPYEKHASEANTYTNTTNELYKYLGKVVERREKSKKQRDEFAKRAKAIQRSLSGKSRTRTKVEDDDE